MTIRNKLSLLAASAVLVLALTLGVTAVFAQSDGDDASPDTQETVPQPPFGDHGFRGQRGFPGQFGQPEGLTAKDELLAEALGIDVETLTAAREAAREAAIEQALAEGLITEEQAEMMLDGSFGHGFHRGPGFHGFGTAIDHEALLADALDISVEELQDAYQQAHEAALAELVAAGYLTEEEAELMQARQALREAIDHQALLAEVLGVSEAELEEAQANRETMAALIEESGLSVAEFREAMQAAKVAAEEQAVDDGVITAEQYEALQDAGAGGFGFGGPGYGGPCRGGHGRPGGFGGPAFGGRGFNQPSSVTSPTANSI